MTPLKTKNGFSMCSVKAVKPHYICSKNGSCFLGKSDYPNANTVKENNNGCLRNNSVECNDLFHSHL